MEPKFQSSFIPKGPIATSGDVTVSKTREKSLFGLVALIIFIISLAMSLGVFGYQKFLGYRIAKMGEELEAARTALETDSITELIRLDARLIATERLLSRHTIISPLFEFLETSTVKSVRFTDVIYGTTDKGLELLLKGQARSYAAVALQAEAIQNSAYFKNPVFSDLRLDDKGNVIFSFAASVDPSFVSYKKDLEKAVVSRPSELATSTPSTATSTSSTQATSSEQSQR